MLAIELQFHKKILFYFIFFLLLLLLQVLFNISLMEYCCCPETLYMYSLGYTQYIVWSTRSSNVWKLCRQKKLTIQQVFFILSSSLHEKHGYSY